jgi:hypothetical protein
MHIMIAEEEEEEEERGDPHPTLYLQTSTDSSKQIQT